MKGGIYMMPLSFAKAGETHKVQKITGKDETRRFLNNLGFVEGENISIVTENAGNLIVNVKDTRIAISKEMATRVVVQ